MNYYIKNAILRILFRYRYLLLASVLPFLSFATVFEDLDKPPDGAYKGQIFVGAYLGMGVPFGSAITAEEKFVKNTTYTFTDQDTTKEVLIGHLSFSGGLYSEYMPIDHVGAKLRLGRTMIVQRTLFGANFKNEKGTLYKDYNFSIGPNFHLTNRKPWDVTLYPFIGYGIGTYQAAPVAKKLFKYNEKTKNDVSSLIYGTELDLAVYFSGGLFINLGLQWLHNTVTISKNYYRSTPSPSATYMSGSKTGSIDSFQIIFASGYAFKN
jgi:hypothetical protein